MDAGEDRGTDDKEDRVTKEQKIKRQRNRRRKLRQSNKGTDD